MRESFEFNETNFKKAHELIAQYPEGRQASAVLGLLDLGQRQNDGWVSNSVIEYVAGFLGMSFVKVYEVATFYSMFNLKPVGKYHVQVCGTTPCRLRNAGAIIDKLKDILEVEVGQTTKDGCFTLSEVECLGACKDAPMMQINDDYHVNLTPTSVNEIIQNLKDSSDAKTRR